MTRKNYSLAHPIVITGLVIVGAVVLAWAGLSGGWLKTQVLPESIPSPITLPVPGPSVTPIPVAAALTARPTITKVEPDHAIAEQSNHVPITLTGTGFVDKCLIRLLFLTRLDAECEYENETTVAGDIPADQLLMPGIAKIYVRNPDNKMSERKRFFVINPEPDITSISPTTKKRDNEQFEIIITGDGFTKGGYGSRVQFILPFGNNRWQTALPDLVRVKSNTEISFKTYANISGNYKLRVMNPEINNKGGGRSSERTLTVTP